MRKNAMNRFKQMNITGNELEDIFIPEKRKICQNCHKIRIKTLMKLVEKISAFAKVIITKISINILIIYIFHRMKSKIFPVKMLKKTKLNLKLNLRRMKKEINM